MIPAQDKAVPARSTQHLRNDLRTGENENQEPFSKQVKDGLNFKIP